MNPICPQYPGRAGADYRPAWEQQQSTVARLLHGIQALRGHGRAARTVHVPFRLQLRMHQGACVLVGEGLTLAVGALGAHVCAVCHLIGLKESAKSQSWHPGNNNVHVWH